MTFESRKIDLDPWKIREFRAGTGSPVVLLHGLSGSFRWWVRNAETLASRYAVAGLDLVGFGSHRRFTGSPLPLDFHESVALLRRWIESRVGAPAHVIGHSMGAQLAIHLAATHPATVKSLVLVSSSGLPVNLSPGPHLAAMFRPPGSLLSFLPVLAWDAFRAGPTSIGIALGRILRDDVRPLLEMLNVPTLLIWGEDDPLIPLHYAHALRDSIAGSRLEILPEAGHMPMWDRPELFNAVVLDHLDAVESGRAAEHGDLPTGFNWGVGGCEAGMCYRENGGRKDAVLVHGLGMGTEYLGPLARSLGHLGVHAVAPDLPGFGHSRATRVGSLDEIVEVVIRWADRLGLRDRLWIGHSTGAQVIERLMRKRPDLVRHATFASPVWNRERLPPLWLVEGIVRDAPKDSPHLLIHALRAYWEAGLLRLFRSFLWYTEDAGTVATLPESSEIVYGESDPMIHRDFVETLGVAVHEIQGAHGVVFTHPDEVARIVVAGGNEAGAGGNA